MRPPPTRKDSRGYDGEQMSRGRPVYDFRSTVGVEVNKSIRSVLGPGRYFRYHAHTRAPELRKWFSGRGTLDSYHLPYQEPKGFPNVLHLVFCEHFVILINPFIPCIAHLAVPTDIAMSLSSMYKPKS